MKLFLIVLLPVSLLLVGWKRAADVIAEAISQKLKVEVRIENIEGDLNHIFIDNVKIGNPSGSELPFAFTCQRIEILAGMPEFLKQDVVIQEIDMDTVYFDIEFNRK